MWVAVVAEEEFLRSCLTLVTFAEFQNQKPTVFFISRFAFFFTERNYRNTGRMNHVAVAPIKKYKKKYSLLALANGLRFYLFHVVRTRVFSIGVESTLMYM